MKLSHLSVNISVNISVRIIYNVVVLTNEPYILFNFLYKLI